MKNFQEPTGEFRKYIEIDGRWRYVYILRTFYHTQLLGDPVKMVEYKLTKSTKTTHAAERSKFHDSKPAKKYEGGLS